MHSPQDYLGLQLSRMEKWLLVSHLCSTDLSSLTSLQVRSPGDLIWRWALHCEHATQQNGRAQLRGPTFASHLILKSCLPNWLGTFLPPDCQRQCLQAERGRKASFATRWQTQLLPSLLGRACYHFCGAISGALGYPNLYPNRPLLPSPQVAYHGAWTCTIL